MSWYDAIKDAISVAQKADNIPLLQSLLDVQKQALELLEENTKLKNRINELEDIKALEKRILRYDFTVVTLDEDEKNVSYCSACWDENQKLIQVHKYDDGTYKCPICSNGGIFDKEKKSASVQRMGEHMAALNRKNFEDSRRRFGGY